MGDLTSIFNRIEQGEATAARELLPFVYDELRKLAAHKMSRDAPGQTLQPTALVHEAWLRLAGDVDRTFTSRAHFFNAAAEAMRHILVDRARRRQSLRHGGGQERVDAEDLELAAPEYDEQLLAMHEALEALAMEHPAQAEVVKLRFFVGLTDREVAEALGLSERTVGRYWAYAKAWLFRQLGPST